MRHPRRSLLLAGVGLTTAPIAWAQTAWPNRPLRLVVPYTAGGNVDSVGRWVAERLGSALGQPVVVENRAGAGATIGAQAVARAAPDGYTLLMAPTAVVAITQHLRKLPYDPDHDLIPVACISSAYGLVAARKDLPARNMSEFIALARSQPGRLSFGSAGPATATHLSGEVVHFKAGIQLVHVPYKGSAESLTDLVAGRIDLIYDPVALAQVKAGKVKALAASSEQRHPDLPDIPTLREQGLEVPGGSWFGLFAPRDTPSELIERTAAELARATAAPGTRETFLRFGQYPDFLGPDAFARRIRADSETFRDLIVRAGIKVE